MAYAPADVLKESPARGLGAIENLELERLAHRESENVLE